MHALHRKLSPKWIDDHATQRSETMDSNARSISEGGRSAGLEEEVRRRGQGEFAHGYGQRRGVLARRGECGRRGQGGTAEDVQVEAQRAIVMCRQRWATAGRQWYPTLPRRRERDGSVGLALQSREIFRMEMAGDGNKLQQQQANG
jgi:hypothetical protein